MDAVTGRRSFFPFAERSLTGDRQKMTPEEEQTEKREVTWEVYALSKKCDRNWRGGCLREWGPTNL